MKESEFVEKVLTEDDQRALSKQWYGDAHYSEKEIGVPPKTIKRNGRIFTMMTTKQLKGFTFLFRDNENTYLGDVVLIEPGKKLNNYYEDDYFDDAYFLDKNDKYYFFEGEDRDFIYQIPVKYVPANFKPFSLLSAISSLAGTEYDINRDMTDYEMDTLL